MDQNFTTEQVFSRTERLIGKGALSFLQKQKVAVFGIGGVGGYVAEGLARAGIGGLALVDRDVVDVSNLNRQIVALASTVGKGKVDVMKARIAEISPRTEVVAYHEFFLPENADFIDFSAYDYVVDCVDTVTAKILIVQRAKQAKKPCITAMGAGNRLQPLQIQVADIAKTDGCPLAKVMRRELRKRGVFSGVKAAFAPVGDKERMLLENLAEINERDSVAEMQDGASAPVAAQGASPKIVEEEADKEIKKPGREKIAPGSISFLPALMGMTIAGTVVDDLLKIYVQKNKENCGANK